MKEMMIIGLAPDAHCEFCQAVSCAVLETDDDDTDHLLCGACLAKTIRFCIKEGIIFRLGEDWGAPDFTPELVEDNWQGRRRLSKLRVIVFDANHPMRAANRISTEWAEDITKKEEPDGGV